MYLQTAASEGNLRAVALGVVALVVVIVLLDQFVWRPLIAWTDRFKVDMVEGDEPPRSWFLDLISRAWLIEQFGTHIWRPFSEWVDRGFQRRTSGFIKSPEPFAEAGYSRLAMGVLGVSCFWLYTAGIEQQPCWLPSLVRHGRNWQKGLSPLSYG